jgi:hypothetical protein
MQSNEFLALNLKLYEEMKKLAQRQVDLILTEHLDDFLTASRRRQKLQERISANVNKNQMHKETAADPIMEEKCRALSLKIADTIGTIQDLDRKMEELILDKRGELFAELTRVRHGQKALRSYAGKTNKRARFVETRG